MPSSEQLKPTWQSAAMNSFPDHTGAADTLRSSSSCRIDAAKDSAEESEGAATVSNATAKRLMCENEPQHEDNEEESVASVCFAAPIPHTRLSAPVELAAMGPHVDAAGCAVRELKAEQTAERGQAAALSERPAIAGAGDADAMRAATAAAGSTAAEEATALQELERAIEATHPAVAALVRAHSQLYRILSDGGGSEPEQGQRWAHCLQGCPVQPRERCLDMLSLLAHLQQAPDPPAYRVFHVLNASLFDCLEHVADADLADMRQAAEYLQLPKQLVTRVAQHAEARALRLASPSSAALPAALKGGALSSLADACLAAIPPLFMAAQPGVEVRSEYAALGGRSDYHHRGRAPATLQRRLLANPYFLHGLCGAPWAWLPGCAHADAHPAYVTGLLLAAHPLPARLSASTFTVAAAVAVGNGVALKRLLADDTDPSNDSEVWRTTALNAAAYCGLTGVIEWLISEAPPDGDVARQLSDAAGWAAAAGHLPALQQLLSAGGDFNVKTTAAAAVSRDGLPLLQFLRAAGCPWDGNTPAQAAASGHQELLEWAIAEGCPKDACACAAAATTGNLPLLQWLRAQGFPWDVRCYIAAAEGRRLDIMRYLRANGCDWGIGGAVCEAAAIGGSLELLQWCIENGAAWSQRACDAAAAGGHLDVLIFAHGHGCGLTKNTACAAAAHGHAACLAWIFENDGGHLTDAWILASAKQSMQVDCVKLAVEHGCKEYSHDMGGADWAGEFGDVDFVKWLMQRAASRGDGSDALVASEICTGAARRGQLQVLELMLAAGHLNLGSSAPAAAAVFHGDDSRSTQEWLFGHGVRFDASVFKAAADTGDIATLVWLRGVAHCPWDAHACRTAVCSRHETKRLATLQWLVQAGCPLSPDTWQAAEDVDVLKWLCVQPDRPWGDKLVLWALRKGDAALAAWALENEPDAADALRRLGCAEVIAFGYNALEMISWARARGGEWSSACSYTLATGRRQFDLVQHCVRAGCGVIEAMFNHAASSAVVDRELLKSHLAFLKQQGCPWSAATVAAAIPKTSFCEDDLGIVKWLMDQGCPYDASACAAAAGISLRLLKALHAMGLPMNGSVCVAAARAGQLDTLQWAHSKGCALDGCADLVVPAGPVCEWLLAQDVACRSA